MEFEVGDEVKYKEGLPAGGVRWKQVGTITRIFEVPTGIGPYVDIQFADGKDEGISVHQIERVERNLK